MAGPLNPKGYKQRYTIDTSGDCLYHKSHRKKFRTMRLVRNREFKWDSIWLQINYLSRCMCKEYIYDYIQFTQLYNLMFIQKARPTRSIARIESNWLLPNVIYNLQVASLFLLGISQVVKDRRILCIYFMIDLECEFHCTINFLYT